MELAAMQPGAQWLRPLFQLTSFCTEQSIHHKCAVIKVQKIITSLASSQLSTNYELTWLEIKAQSALITYNLQFNRLPIEFNCSYFLQYTITNTVTQPQNKHNTRYIWSKIIQHHLLLLFGVKMQTSLSWRLLQLRLGVRGKPWVGFIVT